MRPAWAAEALRFAALLGGALVVGWIAGRPYLLLAAALALYLIWHLYHLYQLDLWLQRSGRYYPPEAGGIWGEVLHQLYRLRRRNRRRKARIARMVREYRMSTAAMPDGVVLLDAAREIVWANQAASQLLQIDGVRDAGQRITNLIRDPDFQAALAGEVVAAEPVEIDAASGGRVSLQLVPYGEGQWMVLAKDVTRLHQLEGMRKDFVANASHELRSPLTVVTGYLESMREDPALQEAWGAPLEEMHRQVLNMQEIIGDLLDLSKLESPDHARELVPVDVGGLLAAIVEDARLLARPGQVVELQLDSRAMLLGSELELNSAFTNLITNACKYTPDGGRIEVRWSQDAAGGHLEVADTGPGIPAEHLPRLTERFYRVDRGRARDQGGSGLGLAIVKHVLQRHGGELEIRSELGMGSRFICHFPLSALQDRPAA